MLQAELLEGDAHSGYNLRSVLEEAVEQFPKNAGLWTKLIKAVLEGKEEAPLFHIDTGRDPGDQGQTGEEEETSRSVEIPALFWKAAKALGPTAEAIPLWESTVDHFSRNVDAAQELYGRALAEEPPLCAHFKARYLSWIATHKGQYQP